MQLSEHVSLAEFTASATATARGIDNSLPDELLPAARETAAMMEAIRAELSRRLGRPVPILISSGYRSQALNAAVGSKPGSDHRKALAVDWTAPAFGTPIQICRVLAPLVGVLGIGQLIYECPRGTPWIHVSRRRPEKLVNRVITIDATGTWPGIQGEA